MSATGLTAGGGTGIRPFEIGFDESELAELRRRIDATRWPERETVDDDSQGVPLATMQELARYWATEYDWRRREARLNALPNFLTEIDGLDIHFIEVRGSSGGRPRRSGTSTTPRSSAAPPLWTTRITWRS